MAQRLSISISEELHTRMQAVKDNFKISKICQVAIEDAVVLQEAKGGESIDILIDRLKKEKSEYFKAYKDEGFKDGNTDALAFSYTELLSFIGYAKEDYSGTWDDKWAAFEYFASNNNRDKWSAFEAGELILNKDIDVDDVQMLSAAADMYFQSWISGVLFIWEQVKDKI
jgi:hypothetical protein